MGYVLTQVDVNALPDELRLGATDEGAGILFRHGARLVGFQLVPAAAAARLDRAAIADAAGHAVAHHVLASRLEQELTADPARTCGPAAESPHTPTVSIAICTKDRAARLSRLLESLEPVRHASTFPAVEILVVDNASVGDATRTAVQRYEDVRYVLEPKAGLDFARNAALQAATGEVIAYLDDDVVVDRWWLAGLHDAWRSCPNAGGFTGLVLPFRLDTQAQVIFEQRGGFRRGFVRREFGGASFDNQLLPVGAGVLGAGCNMAFRRDLLLALGGFDEALDTGAPLPGGGDLDIFYRVLRSGHRIVYEASYAVFHEHRETLAQLRHQYWTWGLGFMAFLVKSWRSDPALHAKQSAMVRWWFGDRVRQVGGALRRRDLADLRFALAELGGGVVGLLGEYDRSIRRVGAIREACG